MRIDAQKDLRIELWYDILPRLHTGSWLPHKWVEQNNTEKVLTIKLTFELRQYK